MACDNSVFAVSVTNGLVLRSYDSCGAVKAPPSVDPWQGNVWVTSHSGNLNILNPHLEELCCIALCGPSSTQVDFAAGE